MNNLSVAVTVNSFVASGEYKAVSGAATPCVSGGSVLAHSKCTFLVTFSPTATGTIKGVVTVKYTSTGATGSPQEVTLTGSGK